MTKRTAADITFYTTIAPVARASEHTTHWLQMVRKLVVIYGVMNLIVLATLGVAATSGESVNTFMWVRAAILLAATALLHLWAIRMEHGSVAAYDRLRTVSLVLPIAVVVIDFIPGVCPLWYAWLQVCVAISLLCAASVLRRRGIRDLFAVSG